MQLALINMLLLLPLKVPVTFMTYFKFDHPQSQRSLLCKTSPPATQKVFVLSSMHQSTFCRLLLQPLSTQHYSELFICLSVAVDCKLFYSSLCHQYLLGPGTWLTRTKYSLD